MICVGTQRPAPTICWTRGSRAAAAAVAWNGWICVGCARRIPGGGLGPDNVRAALNLCTPGGVDFNSGVEDAPGRKNADKMAAAVAAANPKGNGNMS